MKNRLIACVLAAVALISVGVIPAAAEVSPTYTTHQADSGPGAKGYTVNMHEGFGAFVALPANRNGERTCVGIIGLPLAASVTMSKITADRPSAPTGGAALGVGNVNS